MKDYTAANWQSIFDFNGLRSFEDFWNMKADWFEAPNQRRGGWSGVARCELKLPDGGAAPVFLKRQENHVTRTIAHPFRGMPTFVREYRNILRYERLKIPSLTLLYFGVRRENGNQRAVLLTAELAGFRSLQALSEEWSRSGWPTRATRVATVRAVARLLRQIHANHLAHNCFYAKHVFLRVSGDGQVEARIIDLEKTKWTPWKPDRSFRDLRRIHRDLPGWRRADRVLFFQEYLGLPRLTRRAKSLWRHIARRHLQRHPEAAAPRVPSPAN